MAAPSKVDSESAATPPDNKNSNTGANARWAGLPVVIRRGIILVILLIVWQLYVTLAGVSPLVFSGPLDVAIAFFTDWADGSLAGATLVTMRVLILGMLIGMLIAAVLTILATWSRIGEDVLVLLTSMLNPLPAIAILPLAILWFGLGQTALVFVIANAVTWPIAINVSMGFKTINPTIKMVGSNLGLRGWKMVKDVLMPAALPHTISGLKTGWAFGWRTIIAAELVFGVAGGGGGLGFYINDARLFTDIPNVFAGLVTIALIGIALEAAFTWVERRTVIRWGMKSEG